MGLLSKLRSVIGGSRDERGRAADEGTTVTVEREAAAASERAVKGVEPASSSAGEDGSSGAADEPSPGDGSRATAGVGDEAVDAIKGIGPAYADRLAEAGVHTVADLAGADVTALATATDIGEGRLAEWVERAEARTG